MSESIMWSGRPPAANRLVAGEGGSAPVDPEFARGLRGSVNHHLRTPLTVVLGHAELLMDREQELPPEVRQALACLLRAAERLNDVIVGVCDLMEIACVGPDTMDLVDISELVAEEVATYRDRAARRGVRLLISGEPAQRCIADSRRLRRALRALLDNALTYAPDQSTVRVAAATSAAGTRIKVTDSGDGIEAADRARLARPFERGAHPRKPPAGQGMGLALASAVAAWHGGRLVLSQRLDQGLQACIELPPHSTPLIRASSWSPSAIACRPA